MLPNIHPRFRRFGRRMGHNAWLSKLTMCSCEINIKGVSMRTEISYFIFRRCLHSELIIEYTQTAPHGSPRPRSPKLLYFKPAFADLVFFMVFFLSVPSLLEAWTHKVSLMASSPVATPFRLHGLAAAFLLLLNEPCRSVPIRPCVLVILSYILFS